MDGGALGISSTTTVTLFLVAQFDDDVWGLFPRLSPELGEIGYAVLFDLFFRFRA